MSQPLRIVAARRSRVAATLTLIMMVVYFGLILLIAYDKPLLGTILVPGLSVGILLGTIVILVAWLVTWYYVRWTNRYYDAAIQSLK